jgi:hypothetical protein
MQLLWYAEKWLKQHLAARGSSVLHCSNVPPPVREYFQRDIERTKKATTERARQRLALEDAAAAGNSPAGGYDEEAQIQDAINLSRAEAEIRQGVEGRGGTYECGGGSGSAGLNPFQRMLRRAGSRRETPVVVEDCNLAAGGRSGMKQTRIDTWS